MRFKHFAALVFVTLPSATTAVHAETTAEIVETCATIGDLAEAIMSNRQSGVAMSQAMSVALGSGEMSNLIADMVRLAYNEPQYHADANRRDAASRFRNEFEAGCFDAALSEDSR